MLVLLDSCLDMLLHRLMPNGGDAQKTIVQHFIWDRFFLSLLVCVFFQTSWDMQTGLLWKRAVRQLMMLLHPYGYP